MRVNHRGRRARTFMLFWICVLAFAYPVHSQTERPRPTVRQLANHFVQKHCGFYGIDPNLVRAIIEVESSYNYQAVSKKQAQGLMQLMPATQRRYKVATPFSMDENIRGGVAYLRDLHDQFKGDVPRIVAAYYSGEHYVSRRQNSVRNDVFDYVKKVAAHYQRKVRRNERLDITATRPRRSSRSQRSP